MSYSLLSSGQKRSFLNLLAGFVLLDRNFCDEEEEFISNFLSSEMLELDQFYDLLEANIEKSPREICEKSLAELRGLSQNLKQWVLEKLYQLSLADEFLHVDEKGFLEDVNKYWGLKASFGKGRLDWTDDQLRVIRANLKEKMIVTAQPGAGKTAVACAKISHLIDQGVSPSNIWLLSFTRTAVQELRDRISSFSEQAENILGVKIATIDSRAWNIRYGMREQDGLNLFSNYDLAIEDAITILDENKEDMQEFFESLEHIIIDEAQDITGVRLQLIDKILSLTPETCGLTIFGDMAQAIYGFTTDEVNEESGQNLLSQYSETNPFSCEFIELKTIHRTENISLINLIDKLRLSILVEDATEVISPKQTEKEIKDAASEHLAKFEADKIAGLSNTLVLFRRRSDVLQAANFASQEGIDFRIRMSGLPIICRPWIGQLLFDSQKKVMETEEFRDLWQKREVQLLDCGDTAFSAQNRLFDEARIGDKIDLEKIRNLLANNVPPVNLCLQDLGQTGPIIGTVHASKGREAENVQLFMSSGQKPGSSAEAIAEETRILFVGASRAQNNLVSGTGFWRSGRSIASRRVYLRNRRYKQMAQVEIGRADDFDIYSVVNRDNIDDASSVNLQQELSDLVLDGPKEVTAVQDPNNGFVYDLYVSAEEPIWIGQFSQNVNRELFRIKDELRSFKRSLPKEIKHLRLQGLTTVGIRTENPPSFLNPTFQNSGIWCVPVIFGYPNIYF